MRHLNQSNPRLNTDHRATWYTSISLTHTSIRITGATWDTTIVITLIQHGGQVPTVLDSILWTCRYLPVIKDFFVIDTRLYTVIWKSSVVNIDDWKINKVEESQISDTAIFNFERLQICPCSYSSMLTSRLTAIRTVYRWEPITKMFSEHQTQQYSPKVHDK